MFVLRTNDPDISMPPKGDRLSAAQLALLEQWITEGAVWPGQMEAVATKPVSDHWSLRPVVRPAIPPIPARGAVDAFLLAELTKQGLGYSKPAEPRALLRRASVTLTIPDVSPKSLGMLIALYERVVGLYASLIGINAYHQPGVEAGKKAAAAVLKLEPDEMSVRGMLRRRGRPAPGRWWPEWPG